MQEIVQKKAKKNPFFLKAETYFSSTFTWS